MLSIITSDLILELESLNPGCVIKEIFVHSCEDGKIIEFNKEGVDCLVFKPIPSLDNLYEINENGTVIRNVKTKRNSKIFLDMHHSKTGYYATFINFKGTVKRIMIHKVVAEAWIGIKPDNLEVDHIDRNPHNNHYTNLRYVTHSEQMKNRVLSPRIIEQAKKNVHKYLVEKVMKPIKLIDENGKLYEFESYTACARYLSSILGDKVDYIRKRIIGRGVMEYKGFKLLYVSECLKQVA